MALDKDGLLARLDDLGLETRTVDHPPLHTVEESQALRGEIPGAHTKNLFLKDKKGRIFLVVAEETRAVDLKGLHKRIGASGRLSFAGAEADARAARRGARLGDRVRRRQRHGGQVRSCLMRPRACTIW